MRIVAGSRGGRRLKAPPGLSVRPTPDKVREALFAILGERVRGARFLDLFAGTGAIGLEALSRGAVAVIFVEGSASVARLLKTNITSLDFEHETKILVGRLPGALGRVGSTDETFDLVFADPPYEHGHLDLLLSHPALVALVAPDGSLIVEHRYSETIAIGRWTLDQTRRYGDTALSFLSHPHREA